MKHNFYGTKFLHEDGNWRVYGTKYASANMKEFLGRGKTFPRERIEVTIFGDPKKAGKELGIDHPVGGYLNIECERNQHGYAWIGLAELNIKHGTKVVLEYDSMLIMPNVLRVYFKPDQENSNDQEV